MPTLLIGLAFLLGFLLGLFMKSGLTGEERRRLREAEARLMRAGNKLSTTNT